MSKRFPRIILLLTFAIGASTFARAQDETVLVDPHAPMKRLAINAPRPEYPYEAYAKHWTGAGIVLLEVDAQTGVVRSARMLKSTGHQILDESALNAFRRWRFTPGVAPRVKIPIRFLMESFVPDYGANRMTPRDLSKSGKIEVDSVTGRAKAVAIYAPRPEYSYEARSLHMTGNGMAIIDIDAKTGAVLDARMNRSTGHQLLDKAALNAFRQWRFKPGVGGTFKIPITYTMTRS